ncbi:MAG TPA: VWA domain-containing protein [Terriglobales bacterium]|nr:VWA domain-containing protein [Terriglobales bacterium]
MAIPKTLALSIRKSSRLFRLILLIAITALGSAQDKSKASEESPPIKVDVSLVNLTATVTDDDGHAVAGLNQEDFQVYEDSVLQDTSVFHNDDRVPVSVGIVFDTSGSMVDKIDEVQDAVIHFIETTNHEDDIFLLQFNSYTSLVEDFTDDRQKLRKAVGRLQPGGSTALYEALVEGLQHLQGGKHKKKALLLITDGNDTSSQVTLKEAVATAQQSEAIIYALGIGHGERGSFGHLLGIFKDTVDVNALRAVTNATGGRTFLLEGAHHHNGVDQIDKACQEVGSELRLQYTLGYYPKNKAKDGTYRKVRITTKSAKYAVRTRGGYFAPKDSTLPQSPSSGITHDLPVLLVAND